MIDTITIRLKRTDIKGEWIINNIANKLDEGTVRRIHDKNDYLMITGNLNNMKVIINEYYLQITGSLTKYYFDNNLETLTHEDIIEAIQHISYDLGLPIERGYIKRIDIARNIIVRRKVYHYLRSLEETAGYVRDTVFNERVLYKKTNKTYSLNFYDKVKELKKNDNDFYKMNKDCFLKDKNILRYEVKLEKRINQLLEYKSVRVVHLRSDIFIKKLNSFWHMKFKSILTKKTFEFSDNIDSFDNLKKELLLQGIMKVGVKNILDMIDELGKRKKLTPSQKYYSKSKINEAISNEENLIELDESVELAKEIGFLHLNVEKDEFINLRNIARATSISGKRKDLYD